MSPARAKRASERLRQPTEIRRRLIIEAARAVIADRGLFATTTRDIAQAGGVSAGTLSYHFTGLAEILGEVLEGEMAAFYEPIAERSRAAESGSGALQSLIDGFFAGDDRCVQHWRLWLDFWSLSVHDENYARWQRHVYTKWSADVEAVLKRGCELGEFVIDDLDLARRDFMAMFDGLAVQAYLPSTPMGPLDARAHLTGWVQRNLLAPPSTRARTHRSRRSAQ